MASEFEIRQKQKGGEAKRQKDLAKKKASQQASIKAKLKARLKDAEARLKALTNPVSAKDRKDAKSNLGEIRRLKASIAEFKKRLGIKSSENKRDDADPRIGTGFGRDDAGPEGQEERRKEKESKEKNKNKDNKRAAPPPKSKNKGPSKSDIMGGKDGPAGPLGGELDKQKKKKKKSMMKGTNTNLSKNNYGLNRRTGNYLGQR
jgi:hypothetical protein